MSDGDISASRIFDITGAICDENASESEFAEMDSYLLADHAACNRYLGYCWMHVALTMELQIQRAVQEVERQISTGSTIPSIPVASDLGTANVNTTASPISAFPASVWNRTLSYSSSGWPVAYLVATVIFGIGLAIGAFTHVSPPTQVACDLSPAQKSRALPQNETDFVGRITGMVDCQWADPDYAPACDARVPLSRKYAMTSGLLEITYDTGAKVILQGPVTYEVESKNGGFMSIGKLTGKVTTEAARGLAIRTPTAMVTDLGTEFGVEAAGDGLTKTRVFAGRVKVEGRGPMTHVRERTLIAGQSLQIDPRTGAIDIPKGRQNFIREMPTLETATASELIGQADYSETWTANSPTRAGSNCPLVDAKSLRLENCYGNPLRFWVFSELSAITTCPSDNSPISWPGYQVHGLKTGFMECSADVQECYFGFEYGLRDDFIVQFDAVQTEDRINVTIGDKPATVLADRSLSVFFRVPGKRHPEIGVYTPSKGEVDAGLHSGIPVALQWHNYAVRFNLREKRLGIWVDRQYRGTIDLAGVTKTMDGVVGGTWAGLPWSNRCVTIGAASGTGKTRVWTDNFRIGAPRDVRTATEQRPMATSSPREK